jgi:hypothetical protein
MLLTEMLSGSGKSEKVTRMVVLVGTPSSPAGGDRPTTTIAVQDPG